jgi:hypothetical protein
MDVPRARGEAEHYADREIHAVRHAGLDTDADDLPEFFSTCVGRTMTQEFARQMKRERKIRRANWKIKHKLSCNSGLLLFEVSPSKIQLEGDNN